MSNALENSKDLQWDEARLLLEGINPYSLFLDPDADIPDWINRGNLGLTQLPSAVLLFLPITVFDFDTAKVIWLAINIVATVVFSALSLRLFGPGRASPCAIALFALLLASTTPWRITVGNGQYGLVAMAMFLGALHFYERRKLGAAIVLSSLAMIKYNLVLPFFALFLYRKRDAILVTGSVLAIHVALTVLAGVMVQENPLVLVSQSLTLASTIAGDGVFDFFAFQARTAPGIDRAIPLILSVIVIALTVALSTQKLGPRELSILSIVSLVIIYHRIYDAFVLIFIMFHLKSMVDRTNVPPLGTSAHPKDIIEFCIGCFVLLFVFVIDRIVYEFVTQSIIDPQSYGFTQALFSIVLYFYLCFLFYRVLRESGTRPASPA